MKGWVSSWHGAKLGPPPQWSLLPFPQSSRGQGSNAQKGISSSVPEPLITPAFQGSKAFFSDMGECSSGEVVLFPQAEKFAIVSDSFAWPAVATLSACASLVAWGWDMGM